MARTKSSELRDTVVAKPGAAEHLARLRAATLEEIRLYELRLAEAVGRAELGGRLDVTQGSISKLEHSDDVRVSTLRQYLGALGARPSSSPCSMTMIVGCRFTSDATTRPDPKPLVRSRRRSSAESGEPCQRDVIARPTHVYRRAPTNAYDNDGSEAGEQDE
ncbi:MAG: helix-turn-helix domain-containing protein [Acidimicrobiia bacterium]